MELITSFNDLKLTCHQLTGLVLDIKDIYNRFLQNQITIECASVEIRGLLCEHDEYLVKDKTNIVSLFPEGQPFIHLNQTYYSPSSSHEYQVNLNVTMTPSPSGYRPILLIHPNVVVNDTVTDLFDISPLQYSVRPIFKGRDVTQECLVKEHFIDWSYQQITSPLRLVVHPDDRIIFQGRDGLDYTVTSCNSRYEIPINPDYDLTLLDGNKAVVILGKPGDYYFVSRPHKKHLQLYVHVKKCPFH